MIAPNDVLHATLRTVHMATVYARNWTCSDKVPREQVNQLLEAIHELPQMIRTWEFHSIDKILLHLGSFDVDHWRSKIDVERHTIPDFRQFFLDQLADFSET